MLNFNNIRIDLIVDGFRDRYDTDDSFGIKVGDRDREDESLKRMEDSCMITNRK